MGCRNRACFFRFHPFTLPFTWPSLEQTLHWHFMIIQESDGRLQWCCWGRYDLLHDRVHQRTCFLLRSLSAFWCWRLTPAIVEACWEENPKGKSKLAHFTNRTMLTLIGCLLLKMGLLLLPFLGHSFCMFFPWRRTVPWGTPLLHTETHQNIHFATYRA